ncbi:MAG: hypothetical protein JXA99_16775 [Candidatus Lokiarchaeota archaeon]|nr:hypothetical protein [Candidatus Lokiarchaeota archaeon]
MKRIIAIPSDGSKIDDVMSDHFGHCNFFIGINTNDNHIGEIAFLLQNKGHSSCMEPVLNMKDRDVTDMIIGGIGGRPYMGFIQVGINLYQGISEKTVKENIELLLSDKLDKLEGPSCHH